LYNTDVAGGVFHQWSNGSWNDNVTGGAAATTWTYYYRPDTYRVVTTDSASPPTPIIITIPAIQSLDIEQSEVDESMPAPKKRRFFLDD
jgi:hypothetical protein